MYLNIQIYISTIKHLCSSFKYKHMLKYYIHTYILLFLSFSFYRPTTVVSWWSLYLFAFGAPVYLVIYCIALLNWDEINNSMIHVEISLDMLYSGHFRYVCCNIKLLTVTNMTFHIIYTYIFIFTYIWSIGEFHMKMILKGKGNKYKWIFIMFVGS